MDDLFNHLSYTKIPNIVLDQLMKTINGSDFKVYCFLLRRTMGENSIECTVGLKTIIRETGCSRATVVKALKTLEKEKLMYKKRTSDTNIYSVNILKFLFPEIPLEQAVQKLDHPIKITPPKVQVTYPEGLQIQRRKL